MFSYVSTPSVEPHKFEAVFGKREAMIAGNTPEAVNAANWYLHGEDVHLVGFLKPYNLLRPLRSLSIAPVYKPNNTAVQQSIKQLYDRIDTVKETIYRRQPGWPYKIMGLEVFREEGVPKIDRPPEVWSHEAPNNIKAVLPEIRQYKMDRESLAELVTLEKRAELPEALGSLAVILTVYQEPPIKARDREFTIDIAKPHKIK